MAITTAMCNAFKSAILDGKHLTNHTYKIALYLNTATLDKSTTAYSATNETSGFGYTAGGVTLSGRTVALTGDIAYLTFTSPVWSPSYITARGALIYNDSLAGKDALCVIDFSADVSSTNAGSFTVNLPAAGAASLLRIR